MHYNEPCIPDQETIEGWHDNLENFKNIVYPKIYEKYGFSLPEAFMAWQMNLLKNAIYEVEEKIEGKQDF